jgi:hypothetical protein
LEVRALLTVKEEQKQMNKTECEKEYSECKRDRNAGDLEIKEVGNGAVLSGDDES